MRKAAPENTDPRRLELSRRLGEAMAKSGALASQQALADVSGVQQGNISKILCCTSEPLSFTLLALAQALGVSVDSLLPGGPDALPSAAVPVRRTVGVERKLTDLQRAFLSMATRLLVTGKLTDAECLQLMNDWVKRGQPAGEVVTSG